MEPDWDDFKVVLALGRAGSVAGAARALGMDHSTVSRRLSALEDALGARLVMRGGRELNWTRDGRVALAAAEALAASVAEAARAIRAATQEIAGTVRISCPGGVISTMTRMLSGARDRYPSLTIELSGDNRTIDLAKGEADIAIRMFRPTEAGLVARRGFELGWGVFASKDYVATHGTPATIADLPKHRLVLYVEAMLQVVGPRWIEDHKGTATTFTRVDNTEVASAVIASGGGIGVIPCTVAAERPQIVAVFPDPVVLQPSWVVYHEAQRETARVRAVIDVMVEFFEANMPLFATGRSE